MPGLRRWMYRGKPALEGVDQTGVTEEEAAFLYGLAVAVRPRCIAEVGTGALRSFRALCKAAEYLICDLDMPCAVWTCDISSEPIMRARGFGIATKCVWGDARKLASQIHPAPELIFIDGKHTCDALEADTTALWPVAADGALFVYHDMSLPQFGLQKFLEEAGGLLIPSPRGMGILVKPNKG